MKKLLLVLLFVPLVCFAQTNEANELLESGIQKVFDDKFDEAGTPNIMTKELRSVLKDILYQELEEVQERFKLLEPKERIELLIKLMPYVLPKVTSISHTTNEPDWGT